ncbi:MAG: alanine racemase [Gammaproteobacteria bacterium]
MTRPVRARIDLPALQHNFERVRQCAPVSRIMAIVKAHAYGHGLINAARVLPAAHAFGVVSMDEAISLREAGFDRRIVLLEGLFGADETGLAEGYRVDVVVHHDGQISFLEQARSGRALDVWLKIDTGMHRLGFDPGVVRAVVERLRRSGRVGDIRFLSHFCCADEADTDHTPRQRQLFLQTLEGMEGERSLANSAAVLAWPDSHLDWVRPGVMLYGSSPLQHASAADLGLRPVMTLGTQLIAVTQRRQGDPVGYGAAWECPETMPVGIAAIGYGDGYPRHAPSGTPVLVNGRRAALAGRVSMDMIGIDLRGHPEARVGDPVTLWGEGLPVDEVASAAGTISYELFCGVNRRVLFDYVE